MYEARALSLGGWGVFQGVVRIETFVFQADAEAYAERKNRIVSEQAEAAEAVYLARRAEFQVLEGGGDDYSVRVEPAAADIRWSIERG